MGAGFSVSYSMVDSDLSGKAAATSSTVDSGLDLFMPNLVSLSHFVPSPGILQPFPKQPGGHAFISKTAKSLGAHDAVRRKSVGMFSVG